MEKNKFNLNRRDFVKNLTISGIALSIGCSKNPASSNLHPNYPNGNTSSSTTKIALVKTQDRKQGTAKLLQLLEFSSVQDKRVILKPNFNTADPPPASTHNDTLSQIVTELKNRGAAKITLAERSFQRFDSVISQKGINNFANDLGFKIQNLENSTKTKFKRSDLHWNDGFYFPDIIKNAEFLISTCCLKTHHSGPFTMSLKSSVGMIPATHMDELHNSSNMKNMIAEINLAYKPQLIIMDGILTFIDGGPSLGTLKNGDVMIAGTDRVAIDAVGVAILKELNSPAITGKIFYHQQIKRAADLEIGIQDPSKIEFITDDETSRKYAEKLKMILAEG